MNRYSQKKQRSDYLLSIIVFGLTLFGLIAIFSVSKYYSLQITDGVTDKYYLSRQIFWVLLGMVVWAIFQGIDFRFWQKNTKYMLWATLVLLVIPIFWGVASGEGGTAWVGFGTYSIQPAELAKLTLILYLAGWMSSAKNEKDREKVYLNFFGVMALISVLMLIQKDLGTLGVMVGIAAAIYLAYGAPYKYMFWGGGLAVFMAWIAIKIEPYRMQRFLTFLNPESDQLGSGYHIRNALIAIGSGGLWGLGFGNSKQKYLYLPESHTDSIFAIICEELGFLRGSLVIIAFGLIALRGYKIAKNAPCEYSKLVAVGVTTWFTWQAFVNIGAMLSILPLTGVTLPFVSYGGSSLIFLLAATGVLINISKYTKMPQH